MNYSDLSKAITAEDIIRRYNLDNLKSDRKIIKKITDDLINTNVQINDFVNVVTKDINELQNQVDGNITTWFFNGVPNLENSPANEWISEEEKNNHLGDLYYDQDTGYAYRFTLQNNEYKWLEIKDVDVTKALAVANAAQDTADRKRNTFVDTPYPPYEVGDLWVKEDKELYRCRAKRTEGEFHDVDWIPATDYTNDDYAKNVEAVLDQFKESVKKDYVTHTTLETTVNSIKGEVDAKTTKIVEDATKKYEYYDEQVSKLEIDTEGIKTTVSSVKSELKTTSKNVDALSGKINGVSADFENFKDNEYLQSIENLQDQIDGAIQFWKGNEVPTLNNYPANDWSTNKDKDNHLGDIYYLYGKDENDETIAINGYRFDNIDGQYQWIILSDTELATVQQLAKEAKQKADIVEQNLKNNYSTTAQMNSAIKQSAGSIQASVNQQIKDSEGNVLKSVEGDLKLYIKKGKEGKDDLISGFNLNVNEVEISSDNFTLTKTGDVTANSLTANKATIIDSNATNLTVSGGKINLEDNNNRDERIIIKGNWANTKNINKISSAGFLINSIINSTSSNPTHHTIEYKDGNLEIGGEIFDELDNFRNRNFKINAVDPLSPAMYLNDESNNGNSRIDIRNDNNSAYCSMNSNGDMSCYELTINRAPTASNHAVRLQDLDARFTYSTSEQKIGKWIDGKTIYRKTFQIHVNKNSTSTISLSSLNYSKAWIDFSNSFNHYGGTITSSSLNWYSSNTDSGNCYISGSKNLTITNNSGSERDYVITLNYTK